MRRTRRTIDTCCCKMESTHERYVTLTYALLVDYTAVFGTFEKKHEILGPVGLSPLNFTRFSELPITYGTKNVAAKTRFDQNSSRQKSS